jgi:isopenicillin-N N-acyltransferase-like protein
MWIDQMPPEVHPMVQVFAAASPLALPDGSLPPQDLRVLDVPGRGYAAGALYGEACRDLIREHLEYSLGRLDRGRGVGMEEAFRRAGAYRTLTMAEQPDLAAEIDGVARGANFGRAEAAWVLQLRAELQRPVENAREHECTSFAVVGEATADGETIAGQNADLPAFYSRLLVLLRRDVPGQGRVTTLTPAGQIGYHGMNEHGVAVFANFLHTDGWRVGVPRYLLTRIALAERTREAAVAAVARTLRASPRNLLIADRAGATDLETTPTEVARIEPTDGVLAHSNHYVAPVLEGAERAEAKGIANSRQRLAQMTALLRARRGTLDIPGIAAVLRDRQCAPDALSRAHGEWSDDVITIASTIAEVAARRLWIAIGPPHQAAYYPYSVVA